MTLGYFVPRAAHAEDVERTVAFYDTYPSIRGLYEDISGWTGLPVSQILTDSIPTEENGLRNSLLGLRSIAAQLAVCDVLAEAGIRPGAVLALSQGITCASAITEVLDRRTVFEMLWFQRNVPQPDPRGPSEAVAFCHVEPGDDPERFYGSHREGIYAATDFGPQPDGQGSNVILSGYKQAIEELAEAEPKNVMTWWIRGTSALHSPLRKPSSDFMKSYLEVIEFRDPVIPLAGCLAPKLLETGDEVRDAIWRNWVQTASLPHGIADMVRIGVDLLVVPGPSMLDEHLGLIDFPFPVLTVREPADVEVAVAKVEELRVRTVV